MKRLISTLLHFLSIAIIFISFCLLRINFPQVNINNYFELPSFTDTKEFKDITEKKIENVFNYIDLINLYEIKNIINYNTVVATSYRNNDYYNWTIKDVIDLGKTYGITINNNFAVDENNNSTVSLNQKKELYTNLIYDKAFTISNLSTNRMTEYDFCKKILTHYSEYLQLKNEFSDNNSNFTYIVKYYNDNKMKEYYNNNATLNDVFTSKSFIYISNNINEIKSNININNNHIINELIKRAPFENANYYFACFVDMDLKKYDVYQNVFNSFTTTRKNLTINIYTLLGSIALFVITFLTTLLLSISTPRSEKQSSNPILHIPTELLFTIFFAISIICYIILPKTTFFITLNKLTNSNITTFVRFIISYLSIIIFFIIINEKYIGLCTPEPVFILKLFTTFGADLSKIFKSIPIFSYILFFFIPVFLLGIFIFYCFYNYSETGASFTLITAYVCSLLLLLFIIFIIIVNRGFTKTINQSIKSEKMKSDLITNVSHDIRTPLTSIINYSDILSKVINTNEIDKSQIRHYVDILIDKSNRLKKLIDDLIYSSKASSGNLEIRPQKLNIVALTYQFLADYEEKFEKKELNIITNISNTPLFIFADGDKIFRIYENIFDNIIKYALQATDVHINITTKNKNVCIDIDNISSEPINYAIENLSDRFVRGDESRNTEGFGLGLSIVSDLIKLMDGTFSIHYENETKKFEVSQTYKLYNGF